MLTTVLGVFVVGILCYFTYESLKSNLMKNLCYLLLLLPFTFVQAQNFRALDKSPMDKASFPSSYRVSEKIAVITYSRPQLRGRSFDEIVPFDKVWRTGANEATELRVYQPIQFGDTTLKKGTYSIYTLFEKDGVSLIVNSATNAWGAYSYDKDKDVARIRVSYTTVEDSLEAFSIAFSNNTENPTFYMGWEKIRVEIPFTVL